MMGVYRYKCNMMIVYGWKIEIVRGATI